MDRLLLTIASLINTLFLVLLYFNNRKDTIKKIFRYIVVCIIVWIISVLFYSISPNVHVAFFWIKVSNGISAFIPVLFWLFSFIFPHREYKVKKIDMVLVIVLPLFFILASFTNLLAKKVIITEGGYYLPVAGILFKFFTIYFLLFFVWGFKNLFCSYKISKGVRRLQIKYLFLGVFVTSFIGIITNLVFPMFGIGKLTNLGPISTMIFVGFTTYAIIRYRLLDTKIVITRVGIFFILYAIVLGIPFYIGYQTKSWVMAVSFAVFFAT
ncbi:MAG: hypothetical protein NC820_06285, partial [Candidatus Omnitrophica bacterium]|nr:hypothetical protein [Candidatus Omnitrophota bacterium]